MISVISALGMIRLPDVYTRIHAATKSTTLAVLITLTGAFFYFWAAESFISVRTYPRNRIRFFNGSCSGASYHPCGLPLKCQVSGILD